MIAETKKVTKTSEPKTKVVRKRAVKAVKKDTKKDDKAAEVVTEEIVSQQEIASPKEKETIEKQTGADGARKLYLYAVGRRKEAIATVKLFKNGKGEIKVNKKKYTEYFRTFELEQIVSSPLKSVGQADKVDVEARVSGGGLVGQAEAVRLGIARALVQLNVNFKKNLRKAGFLTRDPRVKERKKYGLRRARRAPQWQKR
jgi:small subunit ribosomal protein S9